MKRARGMLVAAVAFGVLVPGCACDVDGPLLDATGGAGCRDSSVRIVSAAALGQLEVVERELAKGTSPDERDAGGNTPLTCAGPAGHVEVVEALLGAGADPNATARDGDTAIADAVRFCQTDVLRALLDAKADPNAETVGSPPLDEAVQLGQPDAVALLLDHGAAKDSLGSHARIVLFHGESTSPCPSPTSDGRAASLMKALEGGVEPGSVLSFAAQWDLIAPLRAALDAGADPSVGWVVPTIDDLACTTDDGSPASSSSVPPTVTSSSAGTGATATGSCSPIVALAALAKPGASLVDVDVASTTAPDERPPALESQPIPAPPLLSVAWWGDDDAVRALLDAGATPDGAGPLGLTALHAAAGQGHDEVATSLLDRGARGGSAGDLPRPSALARAQGHGELAERLEAAGA